MKRDLKGFKDYRDYLSYAKIYLFWMDENEHKQTYDMLLNQQENVSPICYLLQMSSLAHRQN